MSVSSPDVLDSTGAPAARTRRPLLLVLLAAVVGASTAAVLVRDEPLAPQDLTGELVIDVDYERAAALERSDLEEHRNGTLSGVVDLWLPDTTLTGTATGTTSFSMLPTVAGPVVLHAWGTLSLSLPTTTCRGRYAYSYHHDPREAGGAVQLRCDDGSSLGAGLTPTRFDPPNSRHRLWRISLDFEDGWWAPQG